MSRYVDTDVWCEDCKEYDKEHHNCPRFNRVIRTALEDGGMVSVVRCKECKRWWGNHFHDNEDGKCPMDAWIDGDGFCSYGEREGE